MRLYISAGIVLYLSFMDLSLDYRAIANLTECVRGYPQSRLDHYERCQDPGIYEFVQEKLASMPDLPSLDTDYCDSKCLKWSFCIGHV